MPLTCKGNNEDDRDVNEEELEISQVAEDLEHHKNWGWIDVKWVKHLVQLDVSTCGVKCETNCVVFTE